MDEVRNYILSVIAAASLCCILTSLIGKRESFDILFHLICGLFLAFTVIRPIASVKPADFTDIISEMDAYGEEYAARGATHSREALSAIIKQETEAYILDKAHAMDADLQVHIHLGDGEPPVPDGVSLRGIVLPHIKSQIQTIIESELGIPKELQIWIE